MKTIFTWLLSFLVSSMAMAQHTLNGIVEDGEGEGLPSAVVSLFNTDKTQFIKAAVTKLDGSFSMNNVNEGSYMLVITSLGFKDYQSPITINKNLDLGVLGMEEDSRVLDEVEVTAEKPMVQVMADKTVFNVQNTISATGESGFDLLRKAPGVIIDNQDNLIVEGKTGVLIYIDGKRSFLAGEDLINYLKTLQSTDIENVEIITQPSSKYDAEGNAGIVNINLKRDKTLGTNGSVTAGITYGQYARFNGALSFNNRNKKTNVYGSYSNALGQRYSFINLYRTQSNTIFDAQTETVRDFNSNNLRLGFDYFISKKSTIGIMLSGNFNDTETESDSRTPIIPIELGEPEEVLIAESDTDSNTSNIYGNLNYGYKGEKGLTLNIDLDYGRYDRDRTNLQPNFYYNGNETEVISEVINYMVTPIEIDIFTAKVDFEKELWKGKLGLGVKYSKVLTDNQFDFYDRIDGVDIINPERTNTFNYDEQINAAYINYARTIKKFSLQIGLRVENTQSDGILIALQEEQNDRVTRDYTDWFPSGGLTYKINQINSLALNYSRRIQRPNYQSLNPFEYKIDELSFMKGNPFLQPQYTDNIKLSHTYKYKLTTSISYSFVKDYFARITEPVGDNQNFLTTRNVANQKVINLGISYPANIKEWWSIYVSVNAYRSVFEATNPDFIPVSQNTLSLYAQNTFKLPKGYRAEISGWYSSPSIWGGTYQTNSLGSLNVAFQKQLFKEKLTARLSFNDILFTSPWSGDTQYSDLTIVGSGGSDSRQVRFNLTYNFGRSEIKKARQRKTGLEDEKGRIE